MDREDSLFAFLLGAAVGVAVGLLYAPRSGRETRAHLRQLSEEFVDSAEDFGEDVKQRSRKFVLESRAKVAEAIEKGKTALKNRKASSSNEVVAEQVAEEELISE